VAKNVAPKDRDGPVVRRPDEDFEDFENFLPSNYAWLCLGSPRGCEKLGLSFGNLTYC